MRGVGIEEAAAVSSQHLDDLLGGHRSHGNRLLGAFQGRGADVGTQILRHALPDEEQANNDRDRQQDVECATSQIDPKIADTFRRAAGEAANQRNGQRNASCR